MDGFMTPHPYKVGGPHGSRFVKHRDGQLVGRYADLGVAVAVAAALNEEHERLNEVWNEVWAEYDWTQRPGSSVSNTSDEFLHLCDVVERLIRDSAHDLINGRAHKTARGIMAQLAHGHRCPLSCSVTLAPGRKREPSGGHMDACPDVHGGESPS